MTSFVAAGGTSLKSVVNESSRERRRDREPVAAEQPVQLAVEPAQRPVLPGRPVGNGPGVLGDARRAATPLSVVLEPEPTGESMIPGQGRPTSRVGDGVDQAPARRSPTPIFTPLLSYS